jgi:hypothetical protein
MVRMENCEPASDDDYQIAHLQSGQGDAPRSYLSESGETWHGLKLNLVQLLFWLEVSQFSHVTRGSGDGFTSDDAGVDTIDLRSFLLYG